VQGRPGTRDSVAIISQARKTRTDWPGRHNNLNRYVPGWPCTEHQPMWWSGRFTKVVGHSQRIFYSEGGIAHQPLLATEN